MEQKTTTATQTVRTPQNNTAHHLLLVVVLGIRDFTKKEEVKEEVQLLILITIGIAPTSPAGRDDDAWLPAAGASRCDMEMRIWVREGMARANTVNNNDEGNDDDDDDTASNG
jgi:hypothetical protein